MLAAVDIREMPRHKVGNRLDDAKADDEGDNDCRRCDLEFLRPDERDNCSLQSHHAADESIDQDQKRELSPVLAQAEAGSLRN